MAELQLQHLDKIYDNNVQAVYDFNLDVKDGELIVLVGPSGCGKSTTLRMVAGLEDISRGNLRKENPNVIHKKVLAAAEILDLTAQLNKKPNQLSGGQRQRVAMGRAIVRNPKVFLFDEPLSNLDAKLRSSTRREILLLHKRLNATILYVTHDQTEALTLADRIVCMSMGHVQQIGTPLELYDSPNNTFVATFIGLPPMNMLKVQVEDGKVRGDGFEVALSEEDRAMLAPWARKEVIMGVRPEYIAEGGDLKILVSTNENLGMTTLVHGKMGNSNRVTAKFRSWANYKNGDVVPVHFTRMLFFDPETTKAIRKEGK